MFTALAIITMLKYKICIHYTFANQKIPTKVQLGIWAFTGVTVLVCILLPSLTVDPYISDRGCKWMNVLVQTSLLLSLSGASMYLAYILNRNFKLHN
jgi:hypothetical protein